MPNIKISLVKKKDLKELANSYVKLYDKADIVIFNPAVPYDSEWVKYCRDNKIEFYNDYTFFIKNIKCATIVFIKSFNRIIHAILLKQHC